MMPLGDDNSVRKTVPLVTYVLLALNILFFLAEASGGEEFIMKWAFIPKRFGTNPVSESATIFTSMFMHAGLFHLATNMLYLWIFGDNVEDRLGKPKYLLLYLLSGVAAIFSQYTVASQSAIPNVGASGAIAGVLGAYILFFPQQKVSVLVGPLITVMPALIVIGIWFFLQFVSGIDSFSSKQDTGGVAYMAHVGGFLAGLAVAFMFRVATPKGPTSLP